MFFAKVYIGDVYILVPQVSHVETDEHNRLLCFNTSADGSTYITRMFLSWDSVEVLPIAQLPSDSE